MADERKRMGEDGPSSRSATQPSRQPSRQSHQLSNGSYSLEITGSGAGWSRRGNLALTRWRDDATRDNWGNWIYLRDLESGSHWSSGYQPTLVSPDRYSTSASASRIEILRSDKDIDTTTEIIVSSEDDAELRRVSITNRSNTPRTIEVTSYAEVVLNRQDDDRSHPAFFNLFVESSFINGALICKRRPRDFSESPLFAVHTVTTEGRTVGVVEYETDRARFLGRGHTTRNPVAMKGRTPLSGTTGPVLDPVFAMRRRLLIAPGDTARATFTIAFAQTDEEARAIADKYQDAAIFDRLLSISSRVSQTPPQVKTSGHGVIGESPARVPIVSGETIRPGLEDPRTQGGELDFFNGIGGFTKDGSEYVILLDEGRWTPAPWVNVIANPDFGFFVSETGSGCVWAGNSRENRLTPWSNDPVADPSGEAIYLRDEESGRLWTPTPLPIREDSPYVCRHGQGYSVFEHSSDGIRTELTQFVAADEPVKISKLVIYNDSVSVRKISATYYAEWVMGVDQSTTRNSIETAVELDTGALFAMNRANPDFPMSEAFLDAGVAAESYTTDRLEFLGLYGHHASPAALQGGSFSQRTGAGLDPCAASRTFIELAQGESRELIFLLGETKDRATGVELIRKYRASGSADRAFTTATQQWDEILGRIQIRTPDPALNLLTNRWLLYQVLSGRFWGRTAFYQASGAFGFRDQLQDVMSLLVSAPGLARDHIVRCASRQFIEGDVQHWWHPPLGKGVRTRCSDDRLWLPFAVAQYIETTGDESILDEMAPFLTAPTVPQGHAELFQQPETSQSAATVDEHCRRAIAVSLEVGAHGLPFIGSCDWNDGLNRVGDKGQGESVWLGWFLITTLRRYASVLDRRGVPASAQQYREHAGRLSESIEKHSWDGAWYRRAYYDDGAPIGSAPDQECRIDAIAQSWAVLSGAADPDRAKQAMASVDQHLVQRKDGIVLLLAPPFDRGPKDPGYIKGYLPGIRENGGQYTHAAVWTPMAFAALGDGERTAELLGMLNPINHASSPEAMMTYKTEPYVLAGDVYSQTPHAGRGGWTWYTGSAGWMFQATIHSLLGFQLRPDHILIVPCVPATWKSWEIRFRDDDTSYVITFEQAGGPRSMLMDGESLDEPRIPRLRDGRSHQVLVRY
ncbi:MAG TPA: glycosyl transferase [Thermoanaerobaculia bacterium]|nr:glycosyl transferase [Thermoanaerobaculia bacterium]